MRLIELISAFRLYFTKLSVTADGAIDEALAANATGRRLSSAVDHEATLAVSGQSHKSLARLQTGPVDIC